MMTRLTHTTVLLLALLAVAAPATAQQKRMTTIVEYIAGNNIYLSVGDEVGIGANDTLIVYSDEDGSELGAFLVISSSEGRSLVTFLGGPFPLTRGKTIQIVVEAETPAAAAVAAPPAASREAPARRASSQGGGRYPHASGRISLDVNVLESTTRPSGDGADPIERRFTTPALRLRMNVANLPGGLMLSTNLRASSRYSSGSIIEPQQSLRIYEASLAKEFRSLPVQTQVGRFYNPYESFSGYWDGLLLRVGGRGFGVGGAVGFQPERGNETFSADLPKYTAFVNYRYSGGDLRYFADLSFHRLQPRNVPALEHTFVGFSQRFFWRRFSLSQRLQVDRDLNDRWVITQLDVRSSIPAGRRLAILAQYTKRQPFMIWNLENPIRNWRERALGGLTLFLFNGTVGADVAANRWEGEEISYTYSGNFSFPYTALLGLGFRGSASYWRRDGTRTLYVSPGIRRTFGNLQVELSYRRYESQLPTRSIDSDEIDLLLSFPLMRRLYSTLQARNQWGDNLASTSLYASLWATF